MTIELFKRARNKKIQFWKIEVEENRYRTTQGYLDGKMNTTEWTTCEGKRIGSSNETTPEEQAVKEAEAIVRKQEAKAWTRNIEDVDSVTFFKPMLAQKFEDNEEYALTLPTIALQAKLDGARTIGSEKALLTRTNKPIFAAPHIHKEVKDFFDGISSEGAILDGEFYNHDFHDDFNEIISVFKKQKPTVEDLKKSEELGEYHIYDIYARGLSFAARYSLLQTILEAESYKHLHLVPTIFLDNSKGQVTKEILCEYRDKFIEQGYEGVMIRNPESEYQQHRTKDLLKWKEFQDSEYEVVDILEGRGNRAGVAASVLCKTKEGEEFSSGLRGSVDFCRQLLLDKDLYIGRSCTVRYQNLTPDRQVPRFGKAINFNRESYE